MPIFVHSVAFAAIASPATPVDAMTRDTDRMRIARCMGEPWRELTFGQATPTLILSPGQCNAATVAGCRPRPAIPSAASYTTSGRASIDLRRFFRHEARAVRQQRRGQHDDAKRYRKRRRRREAAD